MRIFAIITAICLSLVSSRAAIRNVPGTYATLQLAANATAAGDTVIVAAGSYAGFTQTTDGTLANPITYVANGAVTITSGVLFNGSDYIRLIGFTVNGGLSIADVVRLDNTVGCEIWHNTISGGTRANIYISNSGGTGHSDKTIMVGNHLVGHAGTAGSTGESALMTIFGDNNFAAYNDFDGQNEDAISFFAGSNNRIINNYRHNVNSASGAHTDFYQTDASGLGNFNALFEANYSTDTGSAQNDHHFANNQTSASSFSNIVQRFNVAQGSSGAAYGYFENWSYVYTYNDLYAECDRHTANSSVQYGLYYSSAVSGVRIYNNGFYEAWGSSVTAPTVFDVNGSGFLHDYNGAYDSSGGSPTWSNPFNSETHKVTSNPTFVDYAGGDYRTQSGSPWRNAGGPLTTVTSSSSTGTSFTVGDAGFFRGDNTSVDQYSGNLIVGDQITVGTDQLTISSISGNTITVTSSFTWANGDSVYFGWDTTPEIGPYPATATTLTSATYTLASTTYTVTPNGDTRMVVFFVDGVPATVDNASPWTATIASGTVTIRAYPLYASKTTSVLATLDAGGGGGSPGTGGTYYIATNGSAGNDGLTALTPWPQGYALTNVGASNKFIFLDGTYSGLSLLNQSNYYVAQNKWGAIIQQTNGYGVVFFTGSTNSVIDGFKIQNSGKDGVGVQIPYYTIRNCWITNSIEQGINGSGPNSHHALIEKNMVEYNGRTNDVHYHGMYIAGNENVIRGNVVRHNYAGFGIQLFTSDAGVHMWDNQVDFNQVYFHTNAQDITIYCADGSGLLPGTNYFRNNSLGGGMSARYGVICVTNNIIYPAANNSSEPIYLGGGTPATFRGNYNMSSVAYSAGANNVTAASMGWVSTNTGMFWLTAASGARNTAQAISLPVDFFGTASPTITDMGAFQYNAAFIYDVRTLDPSPAAGADYWFNLTIPNPTRKPTLVIPRRR